MRTLRAVLATILSVSMLFGFVPAAMAEATTHYSVELKNATIPWLIPPPEGLSSLCNEVPEDVHINPDDFGSDRVKHATVTEIPGGGIRITVSDMVKGTASDNFGVAYIFSYANLVTYDFDGATVTGKMKDFFTIKGGDVNYTVGFNWEWKYLSTGLEVVPIVDEDGQTVNLEVVPVVFPTDDGFTETSNPNYISGSWLQHSTRGDIFPCDLI